LGIFEAPFCASWFTNILKVGVDAKKSLTKSTKTYSTLTAYPLKIHQKNTSEPFRGNGFQDGPSGSLSAK
jgi:hypothetical protein